MYKIWKITYLPCQLNPLSLIKTNVMSLTNKEKAVDLDTNLY